MGKSSKQENRGKTKKVVEEDEAVAAVQTGSFVDLAKSLALGSVVATIAPKVPNLVTDCIAILKGEKVAEKKLVEKAKEEAMTIALGRQPTPTELAQACLDQHGDFGEDSPDIKEEPKGEEPKSEEDKENNEKTNVAIPDFVLPNDVCATFNQVCAQLHWSCPLGLASPTSGEASLKAWKDMTGLELDFGPKKSRKKGTPGLDRMKANLQENFVQYLHVLLFFMVLRAFFFRSFFACLPWLIGYQFLSVSQLPMEFRRIPLDNCPVEFRLVASIVLNALVQFFFLYELLWNTYFYEKIPMVGMIAYHAYAFRNHSLTTQ